MKGILYTVVAAFVAFLSMFLLTLTSQDEDLSPQHVQKNVPVMNSQSEPLASLPAASSSKIGMNSASPNETVSDQEFTKRKNAYLVSFQNEEFERAIAEIEALIRDYPSVAALTKDLATTLYASAAKNYERGELDQAIEKLRRSSALGNKLARLALARVLVVKGQTTEAVSLLEEHFTATKDQKTLESLIDLNLNLGLYNEAEQKLMLYAENFRKTEQDKEQETAESESTRSFFYSRNRKLSKRKQLDSQKYTLSRDEVQIVYFQKEAEVLAEQVLLAAAATVDALKIKFGFVSLGAGFNIELVQEKGFGELTGAPPWAGAIFDGTIRIPYSGEFSSREWDLAKLRRMTQHEMTHAFLYSLCGDRVPSWLGEGLAQIQEGRNPRSAAENLRMLSRDSWKTLAPEEDLEQPFIQVTSAEKVRVLYLRSLLLVGELERIYGAAVWRRFFLQMCSNETPYADTLEAVFTERTGSALWKRVMDQFQF